MLTSPFRSRLCDWHLLVSCWVNNPEKMWEITSPMVFEFLWWSNRLVMSIFYWVFSWHVGGSFQYVSLVNCCGYTTHLDPVSQFSVAVVKYLIRVIYCRRASTLWLGKTYRNFSCIWYHQSFWFHTICLPHMSNRRPSILSASVRHRVHKGDSPVSFPQCRVAGLTYTHRFMMRLTLITASD
jgi:hypothetical protein